MLGFRYLLTGPGRLQWRRRRRVFLARSTPQCPFATPLHRNPPHFTTAGGPRGRVGLVKQRHTADRCMPPFGNTRSAGDRARRPNLIHCISLRKRERERERGDSSASDPRIPQARCRTPGPALAARASPPARQPRPASHAGRSGPPRSGSAEQRAPKTSGRSGGDALTWAPSPAAAPRGSGGAGLAVARSLSAARGPRRRSGGGGPLSADAAGSRPGAGGGWAAARPGRSRSSARDAAMRPAPRSRTQPG